MPTQMMYHFCRRRRFIRTRKVVEKTDSKKAEREKSKAEGWEYAPIFEAKFHSIKKKLDQVRRRRWHRKMKPTRAGAACTFTMADSASASESDDGESKKDKKKQKKAKLAAPRMFLQYSKFHKWQLRGYLYQARDLLPADKNGVSDPYARVSFLSQSRSTERIMKTVCPHWDQTLIFENLELFGSPESFIADPPLVNIEIYDYDKMGKDEFIGRCQATPLVKLNPSNSDDPDQDRRAFLNWIPIQCQTREAGELLASFELMLADKEGAIPPVPPRNANKQFMVPTGIRPVLQRTAVEFLVWGLRNMDKYQLLPVNSPSVEISIGDTMKPIGPIKSLEQTPNFTEPLLLFDVMLPKEQLYMPPMHIKVRDNRPFGRRPTVGTCVLTKLDEFRTDPLTDEFASSDHTLEFLKEDEPDETETITDLAPRSLPANSSSIAIPQPQPAVAPAKKSGSKSGTLLRRKKREKTFDQTKLDEEIDWWSKYYTSIGEACKATNYTELNYDQIQVYSHPLENYFNGFQDVLKSFQLSRGKDLDDEENDCVGELKAAIRIYPLPQDRTLPEPIRYLDKGLPTNQPIECTVRVYVVKAVDLQPNDPSGLADPFVQVSIGSEKHDSSDNYVPNSLNPEFGVMFELTTSIPVYKDLHVSVIDYDAASSDDTIGTTIIDLENRLLSKQYPVCGLPQTYCVSGPNIWRDSFTPSQLLKHMCTKLALPEPIFRSSAASASTQQLAIPAASTTPATSVVPAAPVQPSGAPDTTGTNETTGTTPTGPTVEIAGRVFRLSEFEQDNPKELNCHLGPSRERLALHVLNRMPLVKEHVETRPLYHDSQPGIEQGKVIMWVDVFPTTVTVEQEPTPGQPGAKPEAMKLELGPPIDITPRQPKTYEIRVIVWNTMDVILEEENLLGEQMSDIYVKGWMRDIDEKQETDVHYRSLSGEGNFNWRMVFPFGYLPAEKVVVVRKKEHFWSLDVTERRVPAVLCMQIWDNDLFNSDDFLGSVEMSLDRIPVPAKKSKDCKLTQLREFNEKAETLNIFECKHTRGFWPVYSDQTESGEIELTGKLELEIELLTSDEVALKPAGTGQKEPNQNPHLDPPKRPDTSFFWFTSPWKTCKILIWNKFKWYIIGLLVILIVALLIVLFIYTIPGLAARKMVGV